MQLGLVFKIFDIWLILRESLYFSCRMSNLFFLLPKKVDGCPNFTHVYIYSNKPVFSRQTDQTDCTVNSGIINVATYLWLPASRQDWNSFCLIGCEIKWQILHLTTLLDNYLSDNCMMTVWRLTEDWICNDCLPAPKGSRQPKLDIARKSPNWRDKKRQQQQQNNYRLMRLAGCICSSLKRSSDFILFIYL